MNTISSFPFLCQLIHEMDHFSINLPKEDGESETLQINITWNQYKREYIYNSNGKLYTHQQLIVYIALNIPKHANSMEIVDKKRNETYITDQDFIESLYEWRHIIFQD